MTAMEDGCPVLWCERAHSPEANPCHTAVIQRKTWFAIDCDTTEEATLTATLSWQENSTTSPYISVRASGGNRRPQLAVLSIGAASALGRMMDRDPGLYGAGGLCLAEAFALGADILA